MFAKAKAFAQEKAQQAKDKADALLAKGTGTTESDIAIIRRISNDVYKIKNPLVIHEGWLWKLQSVVGHMSLPNAKWKQRYFVLCAPGCLLYFKKKEDADLLKKMSCGSDSFQSACDKQVRATLRYVTIKADGDKCEFPEKVKLSTFAKPSSDALSTMRTKYKERDFVIKVRGFQRDNDSQIEHLAADSKQEAQKWVDAVAVCAQLSQDLDAISEIAAGRRAVPETMTTSQRIADSTDYTQGGSNSPSHSTTGASGDARAAAAATAAEAEKRAAEEAQRARAAAKAAVLEKQRLEAEAQERARKEAELERQRQAELERQRQEAERIRQQEELLRRREEEERKRQQAARQRLEEQKQQQQKAEQARKKQEAERAAEAERKRLEAMHLARMTGNASTSVQCHQQILSPPPAFHEGNMHNNGAPPFISATANAAMFGGGAMGMAAAGGMQFFGQGAAAGGMQFFGQPGRQAQDLHEANQVRIEALSMSSTQAQAQSNNPYAQDAHTANHVYQ